MTSRQCFSKHAFGLGKQNRLRLHVKPLEALSACTYFYKIIHAAHSLTHLLTQVTHQVVVAPCIYVNLPTHCGGWWWGFIPPSSRTLSRLDDGGATVWCGFARRIIVLEVERPGSCPQSRLVYEKCGTRFDGRIINSTVPELPFHLKHHPFSAIKSAVLQSRDKTTFSRLFCV